MNKNLMIIGGIIIVVAIVSSVYVLSSSEPFSRAGNVGLDATIHYVDGTSETIEDPESGLSLFGLSTLNYEGKAIDRIDFQIKIKAEEGGPADVEIRPDGNLGAKCEFQDSNNNVLKTTTVEPNNWYVAQRINDGIYAVDSVGLTWKVAFEASLEAEEIVTDNIATGSTYYLKISYPGEIEYRGTGSTTWNSGDLSNLDPIVIETQAAQDDLLLAFGIGTEVI